MNDENLKPQNKRTKSEQREIARKGGIASGKSRRLKKAITDVAKMIGNLPRHGGDPSDLSSLDDAIAANANLTVDSMILLKLAEKAMKGDAKAIELYFRIRSGEFSGKDTERAANVAKIRAETKAIKETNPSEAQTSVVIVDNIPDVSEGGSS